MGCLGSFFFDGEFRSDEPLGRELLDAEVLMMDAGVAERGDE